jgi:CheY-like chemotaxis protein
MPPAEPERPGPEQAILDELRPVFRSELVARAAVLEGHLAALRSSPRDGDALTAAAREAHTLRGSALTLGLDEAAAALERLEDELAAGTVDPATGERARALLAAAASPAASGGETPAAGPDGALVLCIEDNAPSALLVSRALALDGIRVVIAATGAEGLELAGREAPAAVVLDLQLPDLSGEEVLRRLRGAGGPPVVVVSAGAGATVIERARAAGAFEYLTKPLDIARLREVVRDAIARREPGDRP